MPTKSAGFASMYLHSVSALEETTAVLRLSPFRRIEAADFGGFHDIDIWFLKNPPSHEPRPPRLDLSTHDAPFASLAITMSLD